MFQFDNLAYIPLMIRKYYYSIELYNFTLLLYSDKILFMEGLLNEFYK